MPVVLATGTAGGRRRPLGVALGLALAFVAFTLGGLARARRARPAAGPPAHDLASPCSAFVGLMLVAPFVAEWAGRLFQPLASRARAACARRRRILARALVLGAALSLVWTPCAGPILAAVTSLAAEHHLSGSVVLITAAYAAGATAAALRADRCSAGARSAGFATVRRHGLALAPRLGRRSCCSAPGSSRPTCRRASQRRRRAT